MSNEVHQSDSDHSAERAAEEARRREQERRAEEAARQSAEAAAQARDLANQVPWALDPKNAQGARDTARIMNEANRLPPAAREAFFESLAGRNDVDGAVVAACRERRMEPREVTRALVEASFPPGSERRAQLGEELHRADGSFVPGMKAEVLESAVADAVANLGQDVGRASREAGFSAIARDAVERAPTAGPFALAGPPAPIAPTVGAPAGYSPSQLMETLQSRGVEGAGVFEAEAAASTLRTERLDDGSVNCLERAFELAEPGDAVLLCRDTRDPVGHAVVLRGDGSVVDPNVPEHAFDGIEQWGAATGNRYEPAHVASQEALATVFGLAPGAERNQAIATLRLQDAADLAVADARGSTFMMMDPGVGGGGGAAPPRPPVAPMRTSYTAPRPMAPPPSRGFVVGGGMKVPMGAAPRYGMGAPPPVSQPQDRPFEIRGGLKVPRGAAPRYGTDVSMVHPRMTHGYGSSLTTNEAIATAGRLSEAMYRSFGTEEGEVFSTLRGLSRGDVQKVAYHYEIENNEAFNPKATTLSEFVVEDSMLYSRLEGELDENPNDWARAQALLRGETAAADAVAVRVALDKPWILGGGGKDVLDVLRNSPDAMATIESFAEDYAQRTHLVHAGLAPTYAKGTETAQYDADPVALFKNVLSEKLGANEYAEAVKLVDLARATDPSVSRRLEGEATAARLVNQLDRLFPDGSGALDVLRTLSPDQRRYLQGPAGTEVDALLKRKLSAADYSQASSYLQGNPAAAQATALHEALGRMGHGQAGAFPMPDVAAAENILRGMQSDAELKSALTSFSGQYETDLGSFIDQHVKGNDRDVLLGLTRNAPEVLHAAPAVTPLDSRSLQANLEFRADVLRRSTKQLLGVDEESVRDAFSGLTPEQARQVAAMPLDPSKPDGKTLQDELTRWNRAGGGRFGLELQQMLDGDARATGNLAEQIDESQARYGFETSGWGSAANETLQGLFGSDTRARLDADAARLARAESVFSRDPAGPLARTEADRALAYMRMGEIDYVNSKELTASTAKTVGTAVVVIGTTAVTGGGAAVVWAPILTGTAANLAGNQLRGNANSARDNLVAGIEGAATGIVLPGNAVAVKGGQYMVREAVVLEGGEILFRNATRPVARQVATAVLEGQTQQVIARGGQVLVQVGEQRFAVETFKQSFGQALKQNVTEGVLGSVAGDLTAGTLRGDLRPGDIATNALLSGGVGAAFSLPQIGSALRNAKPADTPQILKRMGDLGATPDQVATVESLTKAVGPQPLGGLSEGSLRTLLSVPPEHAPAVGAEMARLGRSPRTIDRVLSGLEPTDALAGNEVRAAQDLRRVLGQALQPTPQEARALARGMGAAAQDGLAPEAVEIAMGGRVVRFKPASFETFAEQSTLGGLNLPSTSYGDFLLAKDKRIIGHIEVGGIETAYVDWPRPVASRPAASEAVGFERFRQLYPADKLPEAPARVDGALADAYASAQWGEMKLPGNKSVMVKLADAPPVASGITPRMQEAVAEGVRRFESATGIKVGGLGFREVTPGSAFWHTVQGRSGQPLYPGKPSGAMNPSIPKWVPRSQAFSKAQFYANQLGLSGHRLPDGRVATQLELAPAKWVNLATTPHSALDGLPPAADAVETRLYAHRVDLPDGASRYVLPGERVGTVPEGGKLVRGTRVDVVRLNWEDGRVGFKLPDGTVHFYQKIISDLDPSYVVRADGVPLSNSETILLGDYVNAAYKEQTGSSVSLFRHGPDISGVNIPYIEKKYSLWKDYADKPVFNLGPNGEYLGEARFLNVLKALPEPPDLDEALRMIEEQTRLIDEGWDADRVWTRMVEIAKRHEGAMAEAVADPDFMPRGFASRIREASLRDGGVDPDYQLWASVTRGSRTDLVNLGQHELITNSTVSQFAPGDRVRLVHYQLESPEPSANDVFAAAIFDGLARRGGFEVEHAILAGADEHPVPFSVDAYRDRYPQAVDAAERAIRMGALDMPQFVSRVDARKLDLRNVDAVMREHDIPGSLRQEFHDYLSLFKASPDDHFSYPELSDLARDFKEMIGPGRDPGAGWSADRGERGRRRHRGQRS